MKSPAAVRDVQKNDISSTQVLLALFIVYFISKFLKYRRDLDVVSHLPGMRVLFHPMGIPGAILPSTWWNPSVSFAWKRRHSVYKKYGREIFSIVPYFFGPVGFYTSNIDVARQVTAGGHKSSFHKPIESSAVLAIWGMNLIAADGEVWRKHRRILGPAFNNKLYEMVWTETLKTYREMIVAESFTGKNEIQVPVVQSLTVKLALLIIGKCAFGFNFDWFAPPKSADGKISIQECLRIVADTHIINIFLPKWILRLPIKRLREANEAYCSLMAFMKTQVAERKAEVRSTSHEESQESDAFTMLVRANEDEGAKHRLDDGEVIGNVYAMLFAGHETTAHSLAATLGFLSIDEGMQEEIYQHIISVIGHDRDPEIEDYPKLTKVLAAFYEAVRMFPAGYVLIRRAYEDTVLEIPNPHGEEGTTTIPVPKGTQVIVDMIGIQNNPRYFEKPEEYMPSRWYGVSNESEAFSAFSIGPRACIGRKFASLESVCFLTLLLRDYKIEPIMQQGETKQQWRNRVLDAHLVITLGVSDVPIKFISRNKM